MRGLVHNINGPLQNLGMDMELMNLLLLGEGTLADNHVEDMSMRLKRMEAELERIKNIIKTLSVNAGRGEEHKKFLNVNDLLKRELSVFEANLYFKHNVHTEIQLQDDLPLLRDTPKDLELALSLFMQIIIEELESQQIKRLGLKTSFSHSGAEIMINTERENLSEHFMDLLNLAIPTSEPLKIVDHDVGMILVVALLKSAGVSVTGQAESSGSHIILTIPINNHLD
jgi:hypothetical protein